MQKIELRVFGRVQGVGFRYSILQASKKFKVKGFVENLESGEVLVEAEGEKKELEKFLEEIRNFSFTEIKKIEVQWKKSEKEFSEFRIKH
ncbi:MAG: acylphosphatase [archaeon]